MSELAQLIPPEGVKILVALFLSFLIGLEREEHKGELRYAFGGVRTFPLIGLLGYATSLIAGESSLVLAAGFAVIGALMFLSFKHKLAISASAGVTSEVSGLLTFALGALVQQGNFWIAATLVILSMLLLELKTRLEGLSHKIDAEEILTFTKFLLLTIVILPAVPNEEFTSFAINPFKTWLVVVAVSAISYGSYVLLKLLKGRESVLLAAALGGAYSSTVTTVTLAKRARGGENAHLYSGAILVASAVMYLRLGVLLALFNPELMRRLGPSFMGLSFLAAAGGWTWSRRPHQRGSGPRDDPHPKNPLELDSAFLFALIFLVVMVATRIALTHLGGGGVYTLATLMGVSDVDPFILGMTQTAQTHTPLPMAASAIVIAASSNNVVKGIYAYAFSDRRTGTASLCLLLALAALGLLPLAWLQ